MLFRSSLFFLIVQESIARDSLFVNRFVCFILGVETHHPVSSCSLGFSLKNLLLTSLLSFSLKVSMYIFIYSLVILPIHCDRIISGLICLEF